jgi:hypothetical protein
VTPEMAEWKVTLPPMKAGPKPHTLKVSFTIDGEMVHERVVTGIVFGDVWYVAAPVGKFKLPVVKPSGQIVRMIENQSNRDGRAGRHHLPAGQEGHPAQELDRPGLSQGRPEPDEELQDGGQPVFRQPLLPSQRAALHRGLEGILG